MPDSISSNGSLSLQSFSLPISPHRLKRCAALAASLLLLGSAASQAANGTWITSGSNLYLTTGNWSGGVVANQGEAVATFGASGSGTVTVNGGVTVKEIIFESDAGAYKFDALVNQFIELNSGAIIQTVGTGLHSQLFTNPFAMLGPVTLTSGYTDANHTLTFSGAIYGRAHGNNIVTLNGANKGANTISGTISNSTGTTAIAKNGSGTWIISGNNTYTGTTTVHGGGALMVTGTHTGSGSYTVEEGVLGGAGGKITTTGITLGSTAAGINVSGAGLGNIGSQNALTAAGTLELSLGAGSLDIRSAGLESLAFVLTTPGASDQVKLTSGKLNIGDGLLSLANFKFDLSNVTEGGTYILFSTTSSTGIIGSLAGPEQLIGTLDGFNLLLSIGEGEGDVLDLRLDVTAIPEPSSVAITLAGLTALAAVARRRKKG